MDNETLTLTTEQWGDIRVALLLLADIARIHEYKNTHATAKQLYGLLMNAQYGEGLDPTDYRV